MDAGVLFSLLLVAQGFLLVCGRRLPRSPCPRLFRYIESETKEVIGSVTFKNDLSGEYTLDLSMSIPLDTDKKIKITQKTPTWQIQNGGDIEFQVSFPFNHTFPQLTSVKFNGQLYCAGPPAEGRKVTALNDILRVVAKVVEPGGTPATPPPPTPKPQEPEPAPVPPPSAPAPPPQAPQAPQVPQAPGTSNIAIQININQFPDECGINVDFQPLVIAGNDTKDGEYPWLVAMFVYSNFLYNFNCAGSLITDKHVVTAAHCVQDLTGKRTSVDSMLIVMGSHSIKNWARNAVTRGVKRAAVHREYTKPAEADIALLTLEKPVKFSLTIKPICLWSETDELDAIVGKTGVVAGWGRDEEENTFLTEPRQLIMPVVSEAACRRSDERFFSLYTDRTFCAGELKGSTPCTGDSGGGFIMKRNMKWTLRGIVSVGLSRPGSQICDGKKYTVFSDAAKFRDWIIEQMKKP